MADAPCVTCQGRKYVCLDVLDLSGWRPRFQWADLGPGVNDCPRCVQVPPVDPDPRNRANPEAKCAEDGP